MGVKHGQGESQELIIKEFQQKGREGVMLLMVSKANSTLTSNVPFHFTFYRRVSYRELTKLGFNNLKEIKKERFEKKILRDWLHKRQT